MFFIYDLTLKILIMLYIICLKYNSSPPHVLKRILKPTVINLLSDSIVAIVTNSQRLSVHA